MGWVAMARHLLLDLERAHPHAPSLDRRLDWHLVRLLPCVVFGHRLQPQQRSRPAPSEGRQPPLRRLLQADGVEVVPPFPPAPAHEEQPRRLKDRQVLHDGEARQPRESRRQLAGIGELQNRDQLIFGSQLGDRFHRLRLRGQTIQSFLLLLRQGAPRL